MRGRASQLGSAFFSAVISAGLAIEVKPMTTLPRSPIEINTLASAAVMRP